MRLRGLEKVNVEMELLSIAHNAKKSSASRELSHIIYRSVGFFRSIAIVRCKSKLSKNFLDSLMFFAHQSLSFKKKSLVFETFLH